MPEDKFEAFKTVPKILKSYQQWPSKVTQCQSSKIKQFDRVWFPHRMPH